MAKCYMLASMSSILKHQHSAMKTDAEIMTNLANLFGTQNRTPKSQAFRSIMTKTMKEGSSVRQHVLEIMSHLNQIEVLGGTIDPESQFKLKFEMNKRNYTLAELMTELQSAEDLMVQAKVAML
ncbi:uncharacterized protein LOC125194917 [Salvia hispanica]|uniref:uncharacterized protein LOC125194917 n=1 Tax=Salvia hispanica TaxID=49212 RepID=UPI0020094497|nr:uncharacterized protein LOC125194917 [Salvia hispanica]